LYRDYSFISV